MLKSCRHQQGAPKTPNHESERGRIFMRQASHQDIYVNNDLPTLRKLPRRRNGTKKMPSIASLDYSKSAHLEIVVATSCR